jgi:Arc/MetJ family transcription regulator
MRTYIVLDDKLIKRAQKLTGIESKSEVVYEALKLLILMKEQTEVRALRGKVQHEVNVGNQCQSRLV